VPGSYHPACRAVLGVILEGFGGPDSQPLIVPCNPTSARVSRNAYRQADSWSLTCDARDLPFSPTQIKTGQVQLYLYQTNGLEVPPRSVLPEPTIVGLFDETSISYDDSEQTLTIEGQDFTSLFLAKQWKVTDRVPTGRPLSVVLEELIREVDPPRGAGTGFLQLDYRAAQDPIVGGTGEPKRKRKGKGILPKKGENYWAVMTDTCTRYGLILFVEGFNVVATTPRARLTDQDPSLLRMAWGQNIQHLSVSRRMGKERTPQIKCVSWDEHLQRVAEGSWPTKAKQAKTGIGTDFTDVQVFTLSGLWNEDQLRRCAEAIYDLRAMGEQKVVIKTADLRDLRAKDLLDCRAGTPLLLVFDPFDGAHLAAMSVGQRAAYLVGRGLHPRVASAIATNTELLIAFRKPYRVRECDLDFNVDNGIDVEIELQEFVDLAPSEIP
jgi:hypothetical protein